MRTYKAGQKIRLKKGHTELYREIGITNYDSTVLNSNNGEHIFTIRNVEGKYFSNILDKSVVKLYLTCGLWVHEGLIEPSIIEVV